MSPMGNQMNVGLSAGCQGRQERRHDCLLCACKASWLTPPVHVA